MNDDFKIAVIGTGYWGSKHVDEYTRLGRKVVAVDLIEQNLEKMQEKYGCEISSNLDNVLADQSVMGLSICTPNHTHYDLAKKAILAGKHVLLEKPLTLDPRKAWELVEIAENQNQILAVGHIYRFNNAIKYARDMLASNKLGEIYLIKLTWTNLEKPFENRDILFDLAPHPFDIIDYLFEIEYDSLSGVGSYFRTDEGEEAVFIHGKSGNKLINMELSWITPRKVRELMIVGEFGSVFIDAVSQKIKVIDGNGGSGFHEYNPEIIPNNTIQDELNHFINAIKRGYIDHADGRIGAKIVDLISHVRKSMDEGRTVVLNEKLLQKV